MGFVPHKEQCSRPLSKRDESMTKSHTIVAETGGIIRSFRGKVNYMRLYFCFGLTMFLQSKSPRSIPSTSISAVATLEANGILF